MRRAAGLAAAAALALSSANASAVTPMPPAPTALQELQALDSLIQSVGWRLAQGNARFCREVAPGIGLQLQDYKNYGDAEAIPAALRAESDIAVQAVAAGSPAERSGLRWLEPLAAVAGQSVAALPEVKTGDYARLVGLHDRIDGALAATGEVDLVRYGKTLTIVGEPVCVTRFEMLTEGKRAAADGRRVVIGRKLVESLLADGGGQELVAAALAHELAHNVLGHRARLDASGRSWSNVRTTEREADRLMPWLLVNAGYGPAAALRFFERWGPANDYGIFSSPDHDRPKSRMKRIAAEIATVRAALGSDGTADWSRGFKPQAE